MKFTLIAAFLFSTLAGCNTQMAPPDNSAGSDVRQPFVPPPPFVPIVPPTTDMIGQLSPLTPGIYTGLNVRVNKVITNGGEENTTLSTNRDIDFGPNGLPLFEGVEVHVGQTFTSPLAPGAGGGEIISVVITESAISVRANLNIVGDRVSVGGITTEIYEFIDESTINYSMRLFLAINRLGEISSITQDCELLLERV